jgi:hypothetical protein
MGACTAYWFRKFKDSEDNKSETSEFDDYKTGYRNIESDSYKYQYRK